MNLQHSISSRPLTFWKGLNAPEPAMNYMAVAQTLLEFKDLQNSPSVSMWPFLVDTQQTGYINQISIYVDLRITRTACRTFYMNAVALRLWRVMDKAGVAVGECHRPPRTAVLAFGMPFSE